MLETDNSSFKTEIIAEIKKIQTELNDVKNDIKKEIEKNQLKQQ